MGLHGLLGYLAAVGMASVTLVAIIKTGVIPLARGLARLVEAGEVILGTEKTDGLVKRLDQADRDRTKVVQGLEDVHAIVKKAGLLNGKGETLVQDMGELMDTTAQLLRTQDELRATLARHVVDESSRTEALWAAILEDPAPRH